MTFKRNLKCKKQYEELNECNCAVASCLNAEEKEVDQQFWFQSKNEQCLQFMAKVKRWIEAKTCDAEITPMDSVSRVSKMSSASAARMKEEANRAALMAQAAALQEKQALELKEAEIKAAKERLEIDTALAVSTARMKVYEECEELQSQTGTKEPLLLLDSFKREPGHGDLQGLLSTRPKKPTYDLTINLGGASGAGCGQTDVPPPIPNQPRLVPQPDDGARQMYHMMQRQTDIAELLARNQQLFRLPKRDVPVFQGVQILYKSFHTCH